MEKKVKHGQILKKDPPYGEGPNFTGGPKYQCLLMGTDPLPIQLLEDIYCKLILNYVPVCHDMMR